MNLLDKIISGSKLLRILSSWLVVWLVMFDLPNFLRTSLIWRSRDKTGKRENKPRVRRILLPILRVMNSARHRSNLAAVH